jgi:lipopolysaccharide transport system ATP-binding protein
MSSEALPADLSIRVRGLSKAYRIFKAPEDRLKQMLFGRWRSFHHEFWALRDVDLDVHRGETVGLIGINGSGKSTLLQLICGTLTPTKGTVQVRGRIAALLELGAGFNPEFTGHDNVFINGAILGMTQKQMEKRYDEIVKFADIGEFLDQPVKTYSSGMYARLAFAVAIHVDPEILMVDELLSVGDEAFQRKCFARIREIRNAGATVLFVSHAAPTIVQLCDRAVLLDHGRRLLTANPKLAVAKYQKLVYAPAEKADEIRREIERLDAAGATEASPDAAIEGGANGQSASDVGELYDPNMVPKSSVAYVSRGATIEEPQILELGGKRVNVLVAGRTYRYSYTVNFDKAATGVRFGMMIKNVVGIEIAGAASHPPNGGMEFVDAGQQVRVTFEFRNLLAPGAYFLNAGVLGKVDETGESWLHRLLDVVMFRVDPAPGAVATGIVNLMSEEHCEIRVLTPAGKV